MDEAYLKLIPAAIGGIGWIVAYILMIRRGFLDKSIGMPVLALCVNICWEFIFSFVYIPAYYPPGTETASFFNPIANGGQLLNIVWFGLDVIIVVQYLMYGRKDFPKQWNQNWFLPALVIGIGFSYLFIVGTVQEFNDPEGVYMAFGQTLLISLLFIDMLSHRESVRGQSIYIGILKLIGTLGFSLYYYNLRPDSLFLNNLYISILFFDIVYIYMYYQQAKKENISPFMRF